MTTVEPKVFKTGGKQRHGRGFSREEVEKAGSSLQQARKHGVRVDLKRRTAHKENVEALKTLFNVKKTGAKVKRRTKSQLES
jgi:ribosomal protein L13E